MHAVLCVYIYNIHIYIYTYTAVLYTLKVYITHHMYTNHHTAPDSMETLFSKLQQHFLVTAAVWVSKRHTSGAKCDLPSSQPVWSGAAGSHVHIQMVAVRYGSVRQMRDTQKDQMVSLTKMMVNLIKTWIFDFGYLGYPVQYIALM